MVILSNILANLPTPNVVRWRSVVVLRPHLRNPREAIEGIREARLRGDIVNVYHLGDLEFEMTIDPADDETGPQAHRRFVEALKGVPVQSISSPTLYREYE